MDTDPRTPDPNQSPRPTPHDSPPTGPAEHEPVDDGSNNAADDVQPPRIPDRVGPYRILEMLGSGGMGTVFEAVDERTQLTVALKVLPATLSREEGFIHRFTREISALERLSNPHIVKLLDSGVDGETYYYAMEFVDGETLADYLRREKRLPWRDVVQIGVQLCSALKAAHDAGIVHRDLKPSNLLLTRDAGVKLADFGVAHIFASGKLTATGGIVGTAEFMSPEQARGQRVTKKSDLYSLGALLYTMLTGRPPFRGNTTLDVIHKHQYGQFDKPRHFVEDIPVWLEEIVCRLLEKDPEKRYPDAYVLSRRLQEVPRKVQLARSEETLAISGNDEMASRPTTARDAAQSAADGSHAHGDHVGPTLMRDLVRAELERGEPRGAVAALLDNTWVLVGLLVAVVALGIYAFRSRQLSPEDMYERAAVVLSQPPGPEWLEAREDYLEPLLEEDAETWEPRVKPMLREIRLYELRRSVSRPTFGGPEAEARSESERLLQRGLRSLELGDQATAEQTLSALEAVLRHGSDDTELHAVVMELLADLREERDTRSVTFVQQQLTRARELLKEEHFRDAAELCRGLITLYAGTPGLETELQQAREILAETGASESRP